MNAYFCDFVMDGSSTLYLGMINIHCHQRALLNVCMYMYGDSSAEIRSYARQTDDDVRLTLDLAY